MVETKAGKVREKMKKLATDGKISNQYATKKEWLLLDMTETEFPVYKPEYLYWDAIIMVRKLLLSVVLNFMTHTPQTQCILLIIIFLISLVIQNQYRPFYKKNINNLEETTLISSSLVLLVGLIASTKETTDPVFVVFLGILLVTFISGSGILMFWKILQHWYIAGLEAKNMMRNKLKKSIGSLSSVVKKSWGSLNNVALEKPVRKSSDGQAPVPANGDRVLNLNNASGEGRVIHSNAIVDQAAIYANGNPSAILQENLADNYDEIEPADPGAGGRFADRVVPVKTGKLNRK
jgi:Na+/H+-translocating membrane pyrophosphatase